ncbi:MAG TPA: type II toxin-antitoxin system VapC family toxin [Candidatus Acidoferrales bacterium]|nr:type II toxin-antitoxin system VapC family toxin [Candidatus Acidoferrales bacterium]
MNLVVVDASVGAKWFLPEKDETLTDKAVGLLERYDAAEIRFVVPDLFYVEIASAIWKAVRVGRVSRAFGDQALALLIHRQFPSVPSPKLLDRAFQIAADYRRTVYECLYVSLAIDSQATLITADERLANALAAHFPVKWLGAF